MIVHNAFRIISSTISDGAEMVAIAALMWKITDSYVVYLDCFAIRFTVQYH